MTSPIPAVSTEAAPAPTGAAPAPSGTGPPGPALPSAAAGALADALAAEHAAIFAYGAIGARLSGAATTAARSAEAAHRARRDALVIRLAGAGATPAPGEPVYALPFPVTDAASAQRLAAQIEERTAALWRAALAHTTAADRTAALAALVDCAVRATRWRRSARLTPLTTHFPGRPG